MISTIGFSGHYAHGKNSTALSETSPSRIPVNSWGAAVDLSLPFTKRFNPTGELATGRELGIFSVTSGEAIQTAGGPRRPRRALQCGGWAQATLPAGWSG